MVFGIHFYFIVKFLKVHVKLTFFCWRDSLAVRPPPPCPFFLDSKYFHVPFLWLGYFIRPVCVCFICFSFEFFEILVKCHHGPWCMQSMTDGWYFYSHTVAMMPPHISRKPTNQRMHTQPFILKQFKVLALRLGYLFNI